MLVESEIMVFIQTALEVPQDTLIDGCLVITCTDIPHAKSVTDTLLFHIHMLLNFILQFWKKLFFALFQEMYQTTQPFDPEGVLGTVNSIVMGFLGMQVK